MLSENYIFQYVQNMLRVCNREFVIECICYYLALDDIPI